MKRGTFITFEGSEGSGKSTQIALIRRFLKKKGKKVVFVREPGGVAIAEKVRKILLDVGNKAMGKECETLLYMAARAQLVEEVIKPALASGKIVLCDRFLDSTLAYQGYGAGVDIAMIKRVGAFATQGITPELTLVFDIPVAKGLSRIKRKKDRIELRTLQYHNRVRGGYLAIARREPKRVKVIRVNKSREEIHEIVKEKIESIL
jgi:dTMP kinase